MENMKFARGEITRKSVALIVSIAMLFAMIPATAVQAHAAGDSVNKLELAGFGDVYYVVDPSEVEPATQEEPAHTHIPNPVKIGENVDAYMIGDTGVAYYTAETIPDNFYGSSSMTWLEFWKGEGVTKSTLTDSSSPNRDSEGGESGTGTGYLDLGGFDAVTRPTVRYGLSHFRFQYAMLLNGINTDNLPEISEARVPLVYRSKVNDAGTGLDAVLVPSDDLSSFTAGSDTAENPSTFVSHDKTYILEDYDVEGFQRIPVSVGGESYVENMVLLAAGKKAPTAFWNFTIDGTDGADQVVTAATGGVKALDDKGNYGKAAPGVSIEGFDLVARGDVNTPKTDYNTSWGDYADAYALLQKVGDEDLDEASAKGAKTTLSAFEWAKYSNRFLGAKYEYFGTAITDGEGQPIARDAVTLDSVSEKTPTFTFGTLPGADTWYSPAKKGPGGRIELGFQFDSLRLGGNGTNTTDKGIYARGAAASKTGYYRVTLYAAGYNDVSKMVYIAQQLPAPELSIYTKGDSQKLLLKDPDSELKTLLGGGSASVKLQSIDGRNTTELKDLSGDALGADNAYDISDVELEEDVTYRLNITSFDYPDITSSYVYKVVEPTNLSLAKKTLTLYTGTSETVQASVEPAGVTQNGEVSFHSANSKIASVDNNGKITGKAVGKVVITATTENGKASNCTATVKAPTIKLSKSAATIYTRGTTKITLTATIAGSSKVATWTSSNPKVAVVSSKGVVTAKKAGKVTISAKANGVTAKATVTVKLPTLKLAKNAATIKKGKSVTIKATATPKATVTYKSANKKIATVSSKGVVKGVKKGSVKITVKANGISKKFTVRVR
ncbi:MAG: Ig-like domain-containing protein [Clostridiales Family XIII bacterium]|jgi:uncharacterized protein YjdB|nr:Ig-like domain-containing protein [Clostridiales Family XIII bacterium]